MLLKTACPRLSIGLSALTGVIRSAKLCYGLLAVVALLAMPPNLAAQTAELSGVVRDADGGVILKAEVRLTDLGTGTTATTTTNARGIYVLSSLKPSTFQLTIEASGFSPLVQPELTLNVDQRRVFDVVLSLAGQTEVITVSANEVRLGSADGSVGTVIDRTFAESLPVRGRSFAGLLRLTPGVVGNGFSAVVNGQRSVSNTLTVDGVSALSAMDNSGFGSPGASGQAVASTVVGTINGGITMDALQEIRVQTSSFAAEFGRTPGAQISLVTRSGTNQYHGSVFEQFRNEKLIANDYFSKAAGREKAPLDEHQFGVTFGGPVLRGRTFFFASYEGLRLHQPRTINDTVPSMEARQQATTYRDLLNLYPVPTGPGRPDLTAPYVATQYTDRKSDTTGLRIDHVFFPGLQMFARYSMNPTSRQEEHPMLPDSEDYARNLTGGLTATVGRSGVIEVRASYGTNHRDEVREEATAPLLQLFPESGSSARWLRLIINSGGVTEFSRGVAFTNIQRQTNLAASWAHVFRSHHVKLGMDYRLLRPDMPFTHEVAGTFASVAEIVAGRTISQLNVRRNTALTAHSENTSFYVQDSWKALPRLTVTYGVRWDINPAPSFNDGEGPLAVTTIEPVTELGLVPRRNVPLWKTQKGNLFPRFGFSYGLDAESKYVVSGGAGIFGDIPGTVATTNVGVVTTLLRTNVPLPLAAADMVGIEEIRLTPPYGRVGVVDPNLQSPRTTHWNIALERSLRWGQAVSAAYVGNRAKNLLQAQSYTTALNAVFPSGASVRTGRGESQYDSLQVQYRRRAGNGLNMQASYTYAHAKDTSSSLTATERTRVLSTAASDLRHSFTGAVASMLPGPRSGLLRAVFADWQVHALTSYRSGYPFTALSGNITIPGEEQFARRASLVPGVPLILDDPTAPGGRRYNRSAFVDPPVGEQGNTERNQFRGHGAFQVDLGLQRSISLSKRRRVRLRGDIFNLFNTPVFGGPALSLSTTPSQFGAPVSSAVSITSGAYLYNDGGPRSAQLSIRFEF